VVLSPEDPRASSRSLRLVELKERDWVMRWPKPPRGALVVP
jgi:hypothetical protein